MVDVTNPKLVSVAVGICKAPTSSTTKQVFSGVAQALSRAEARLRPLKLTDVGLWPEIVWFDARIATRDGSEWNIVGDEIIDRIIERMESPTSRRIVDNSGFILIDANTRVWQAIHERIVGTARSLSVDG